MTNKDSGLRIIVMITFGLILGGLISIQVSSSPRESVPVVAGIVGFFGLGFWLGRLLSHPERASWVLIIYAVVGLLAVLADMAVLRNITWAPLISPAFFLGSSWGDKAQGGKNDLL